MQEYLTTTTLGDLSRKAREMNATTEQTVNAIENVSISNNTNEAATDTNNASEIVSVIRPSIGEINQ